MECPDCGSEMVLKETNKMKYGNGKPRKFYGCSRFPKCRAAHGAHPDGKPLGHPADNETKQARVRLHNTLEKYFGDFRKDGKARKDTYGWLKQFAPKEHVGEMTLDEIEKTEALIRLQFAAPTNLD